LPFLLLLLPFSGSNQRSNFLSVRLWAAASSLILVFSKSCIGALFESSKPPHADGEESLKAANLAICPCSTVLGLLPGSDNRAQICNDELHRAFDIH
jgi:hypothetical protein